MLEYQQFKVHSRFLCYALMIMFGLYKAVTGNLNLYMNESETKRLLGIPDELYYVRNGAVNDYALSFSVPLNTQTSDIFFNWNSLQQTAHDPPMVYSLRFAVSDSEALYPPTASIPRDGNVPANTSVFRITLKCTGSHTAEVDVKIFLNVSVFSLLNVTVIEIKRRKTCVRKSGGVEDDYIINNDNDLWQRMNTQPSTAFLEPYDLFDPSSGNTFYIGIGSLLALIAVVTIALLVYCIRFRHSSREPFRLEKIGDGNSAISHERALLRADTPNRSSNSAVCSGASSSRRAVTPMATIDLMQLKSSEVQSSLVEIAVDRSCVCLTDVLIEGTFGKIYQGTLLMDDKRNQSVIVKTVTADARRDQVMRMLRESLIMKGLRHEHLCYLSAVCLEPTDCDSIHQSLHSETYSRSQSHQRDSCSLRQSQYLHQLQPLLIYPSSPGEENLKRFLLRCLSTDMGLFQSLNTQQLVHMAVQIARAVCYLHQHGLVHRDIATRNCLVNESLTVRLTDSALSRDIFPHDYHCLGDNENRPIKWLSTEALCDRQFSYASDTWAVGVTIWELMTLGQLPYAHVDPFEMSSYLHAGYRLPQPINCPNELFEMMICSWAAAAETRPQLTHLLIFLQDFYTALGHYI